MVSIWLGLLLIVAQELLPSQCQRRDSYFERKTWRNCGSEGERLPPHVGIRYSAAGLHNKEMIDEPSNGRLFHIRYHNVVNISDGAAASLQYTVQYFMMLELRYLGPWTHTIVVL